MKRGLQPIFSLFAVAMAAAPAAGFTISTPASDACHENITAEALRELRKTVPEAGPIAPDRNQRGMIADAPFTVPDDMKDVAGVVLMLAVRENDLGGRSPTDNFDLVRHHGDPALQRAHCLRGPDDDGEPGELQALEDCKAFIREKVTAALDGVGADGRVDPTRRQEARVVLSLRGPIDVSVPIVHWQLGQALHALQDGFTHSLRTPDASQVTEVLNWVDFVDGDFDEARDGPAHLGPLDQCNGDRPEQMVRRAAAVQATIDVMRVVFEPGRDRPARLNALDAILSRVLAHKAGCTKDNAWCGATEFDVPDQSGCGCRAGKRHSRPRATLALSAFLLTLLLWRRRRLLTTTAASILAVALFAAPARAADPETPDDPTTVGADAPPGPGETGEIPVNPDREAAAEGREPGRDVDTPAPSEIAEVRKAKKLGPQWGMYVAGAGSFDNPGLAGVLGIRYRVTEKYVIGVDGEWNPWIGTSPMRARAGAASLYLTAIRRYPMTWERVNLRTTAHVGASMLLFDMYGAQKYDVGPFAGLSLLGIDFDLGGSWRLVIDPADLVVPVPHITGVPLYYPQYRFTVGLQFGS